MSRSFRPLSRSGQGKSSLHAAAMVWIESAPGVGHVATGTNFVASCSHWSARREVGTSSIAAPPAFVIEMAASSPTRDLPAPVIACMTPTCFAAFHLASASTCHLYGFGWVAPPDGLLTLLVRLFLLLALVFALEAGRVAGRLDEVDPEVAFKGEAPRSSFLSSRMLPREILYWPSLMPASASNA